MCVELSQLACVCVSVLKLILISIEEYTHTRCSGYGKDRALSFTVVQL